MAHHHLRHQHHLHQNRQHQLHHHQNHQHQRHHHQNHQNLQRQHRGWVVMVVTVELVVKVVLEQLERRCFCLAGG